MDEHLDQGKPYEKRKRSPLLSIAEQLSSKSPDLKQKLALGGINQSPVQFVEKAIKGTVSLSLLLLILTYVLFTISNTQILFLVPLIIIYPFLAFQYLMLYPHAAMIRRRRLIDRDIVFAGRHMTIAIRSGLPLFDAMVGVSQSYGEVGKEFAKIVERISLGTPMSQAIREVAQDSPSKYFVRVVMQIANSLSSGADMGQSLETVLDQISREQMIQLKEYGQKLTPIVMFFMVFGIIIPSIGVVLATVLFSVISAGELGIESWILAVVFAGIAIVQFLFIGLIESSRPRYLIY